jgi:YD repeat-containing protein
MRYNDSAYIVQQNSHHERPLGAQHGRFRPHHQTLTGYSTTTVSQVDTVYVSCGCSPIGKMGQQSAPHTPTGAVYWTTYTYDGLGRTTQKELPDGSITHYSYAGNTVTVNDPASKTKTFTIDALGNLTQVQEPDPTLGTVSTNYTYDILNHLIQVSMPRGSNTQTRTFNYNTGTTVGTNLLSATNPENGTVTYTYNSDSTLHTKTDAKSQVFTYSYDSYKRLTQIMVGSTVLRTFMYDTNTLDSTFSGSYTQGRLVAVQNTGFTPNGYVGGVGGNGASVPSGVQLIEMYGYTQAGLTSGKRLQVEETFNWYQNNNPESSTQKLNLDATYTYDIEGKATSVNYPSTYSYNPSGQLVTTPGPKYTYSFDSMDRPTGLTDQSNNTDVSNVTYNAANQLLGLNYLGIAETRQYNNLNQMTNLTAGSLINITYTYPAGANDGKISQQTNAISAETVTYQYDSLNRLLSATSSQSWSETYGYDGFGNLQSKTPTGGAPTLSQAVNAATNQIVGVTYDANGNQLSGGYGYDAENRMATATGIQYGYDSRNKRVWSGLTSGSTVTQTVYFYGVDGQRLGIYSFTTPPSEGGSPQLSALAKSLAVYFGGKRVGTVTNGATANFTQDRLGSNGTYYPYGEARGTRDAG